MSWNGVKQQVNKAEIENWCDEMGIEKYTINSKGEIDVNGNVDFRCYDFKELPYKFGTVDGFFTLMNNKNLTSLKNCPDYVGNYFSCSDCPQLDSLEGCPKEVCKDFCCYKCKKQFTKEYVNSLCKAKGVIDIFY